MLREKSKRRKWLRGLLWGGGIATLAWVGAKLYYTLKPEVMMEKRLTFPVGSRIDELKIKIGHKLFPLIDERYGSKLLERIPAIRTQLMYEFGLPLPLVRIVDDFFLNNSYVICIKGVQVASGKIMPGNYMAIKRDDADETVELDGIETIEPTHNIPAIWIEEAECEKAAEAGYLVVDPLTVILTHMKETFIQYAPDIFGLQETQKLLDNFKHVKPVVVDEVIPDVLTLVDVNKILRKLLAERVSIRDLGTILETLADHGRHEENVHKLVEYVRQALGRQITGTFLNSEGQIEAVCLSSDLESRLLEMHNAKDGLDIESELMQELLKSLTETMSELTGFTRFQENKIDLVLICHSEIRSDIRETVQRVLPKLTVLSYDEMLSDVKVEIKETIEG